MIGMVGKPGIANRLSRLFERINTLLTLLRSDRQITNSLRTFETQLVLIKTGIKEF